MKKLWNALAVCGVLVLVVAQWTAFAEPITNNAISATATSQTIYFGGQAKRHVCIRGGATGEQEVFYRLFTGCDTVAAATTSNVRLEATEVDCYTFDFASEGGGSSCVTNGYVALSIVCTAAETSTPRYAAK